VQAQASDAELVERSRSGSADAFAALVKRHQAAVRGFLSRYLRGRDAIDDLAQEVFVGALRGLGAYRGDASLRLWLLAIARRVAATHLREEVRRRARAATELELAVLRWHADELEAGVASIADERELAALEACVRGLSRDNAELVSAYYFKGASTAEIARRNGRGEGAVRMALLRVRQALRACVEQRIGGTA
jgi:RNA polymerase sigma factor (sigma-70 family)